MAKKSSKSSSKSKLGKMVTFEYYAPEATEVGVAGTFNDWDSSQHPLKKEKGGKWKLKIKLPIGRYEYRYRVDGDWQNDQRTVECVPNAFGTWNCVVNVK